MPDQEPRRCAYGPCGRAFPVKATGRKPLYCSGNCRQAAHRDQVREAELARQLADRLATAQTTAACLFPAVERTAYEIGDKALQVFGAMADPEAAPDALGKALGELMVTCRRFEQSALDYQDATSEAARLTTATAYFKPKTN